MGLELLVCFRIYSIYIGPFQSCRFSFFLFSPIFFLLLFFIILSLFSSLSLSYFISFLLCSLCYFFFLLISPLFLLLLHPSSLSLPNLPTLFTLPTLATLLILPTFSSSLPLSILNTNEKNRHGVCIHFDRRSIFEVPFVAVVLIFRIWVGE